MKPLPEPLSETETRLSSRATWRECGAGRVVCNMQNESIFRANLESKIKLIIYLTTRTRRVLASNRMDQKAPSRGSLEALYSL